ncbi:MAG: hypothetical protein ACRENE_15570, partial [Polyangiaceae bacterium]
MKPWLGHGSSNAFSALVVAVAACALAGATGCSSSSSAAGDGGGGGGGGGGSAEGGIGPDIVGTGMMCPPNTHETVGAKITLTVQWPQTLANNGCDDKSTPPCSAPINIWLLTHYDINGTAVTGTVDTCKNVTPPIPLTSAGTTSEGQDPMKGAAVVTTEFDDSVWTNIIKNPMHVGT